VITFTYDTSRMTGPPFSVTEEEVHHLYEGARVELIDEGRAEGTRFRDVGLEAREMCFAITF
jgi:hypothetical protein